MIAAFAAAAVLATGPAAAAAEEVPTRECGSRVESGRGPLSFAGPDSIQVGPISFWLLRRAERSLGPRDADGRYLVKSAVSVRAGRAVTLTVPERWRGRLGLLHARTREPVASVRLVPCPPATRAFSYDGRVGSVTGFNGGFSLTRTGCYPLDVRVEDGRAYRVRIAFGYPCR